MADRGQPDHSSGAETLHGLRHEHPAISPNHPRTDERAGVVRQTLESVRAALEQATALNDLSHGPDHLRTVEHHLDSLIRLLNDARRDVMAMTDEVVHWSLPQGMCGVAWPVCSHCPGIGLTSSAGSSRCPSCGTLGPSGSARPTYRCIERATITVRDATGAKATMCLSHAAGALRRIERLSVEAATAEEVRRLVGASDRPLRIDLAREVTPPARDTVGGPT